jgi:pimeloyl-ACP methyl ester carboxylesterase
MPEERNRIAVDAIAAQGFRHIVGLVLAPHYSSYSIGQYLDRAKAAAEPHGITVSGIESWATEPAYVQFIADDLKAKLDAMPADTKVLFTAHSLPQRIVDAGDPYPDELRSTAVAVAEKVAIDHPDRVLTLGAFAGSPGIKHGNQDHMKWLAHMREKGLATFLRETIVDRFDPKTTDPGFLDWFIEESARNSVEMLGRFVPMMKTFDVLDELSRIRCPTLAVAPGGDPIHTVDQYRVLPDLIANCEFLVYEGMPHTITDAVPDRCAQDLCRFMLKHKGGK